MSSEDCEFRISAFTPSGIPMARLTLYGGIGQPIGQLGERPLRLPEEGKRARRRARGKQAAPKVRLRVNSARDPTGPPEVRRHFKRIDDMLCDDNAVGNLKRGRTNIIGFPGKRAAVNEAYAFTESATLEGTIARVGGIDETAHRSKLVHSRSDEKQCFGSIDSIYRGMVQSKRCECHLGHVGAPAIGSRLRRLS